MVVVGAQTSKARNDTVICVAYTRGRNRARWVISSVTLSHLSSFYPTLPLRFAKIDRNHSSEMHMPVTQDTAMTLPALRSCEWEGARTSAPGRHTGVYVWEILREILQLQMRAMFAYRTVPSREQISFDRNQSWIFARDISFCETMLRTAPTSFSKQKPDRYCCNQVISPFRVRRMKRSNVQVSTFTSTAMPKPSRCW